MKKKIERKSLVVTMLVYLLVATAGVWVYVTTGIQALFLDCFFSVVALVSTISGVFISKYSKTKTKHYPNGIWFLEPLYAVLKCVLTFIVMFISVFKSVKVALEYFITGIGKPINFQPVIPYSIIMVILCFGLGFFNQYQNKKINNSSVMLESEAKINMLDGIQSGAIGLAVCLLFIFDTNSSLGFLHYVGDAIVTLICTVVTFKMPLMLLINSFRELTGSTTSNKEVLENVRIVLEKHFELEKINYNVYKIGMKIKIEIICEDIDIAKQQLKIEEQIIRELSNQYEFVEMQYCL